VTQAANFPASLAPVAQCTFAAGVNDTVEQLASGINDIGGDLICVYFANFREKKPKRS
jgi:hypothetical protein